MEANSIFSQNFYEALAETVSKKVTKDVTKNVLEAIRTQENEPVALPLFHEYIPKTEVRGTLASSSTLWNWENSGKLKLYAIGGKRFYKRTDIEALFTEVKKKGALNE